MRRPARSPQQPLSFGAGLPPLMQFADGRSVRSREDWARRRAEIRTLLGLFHGHEADIPYDFDDVLSLIAPRPCLIVAPTADRTADHAAVMDCSDRARVFWDRSGQASRFEFVAPDDDNRLRAAQQDLVLSWLRRHAEPDAAQRARNVRPRTG